MVVDAELDFITVKCFDVLAHQLCVSDINGDNGLRLEILACADICYKIISCRKFVMADNSASDTEFREYIFKSEACTDTVAVRTDMPGDADSGSFAYSLPHYFLIKHKTYILNIIHIPD